MYSAIKDSIQKLHKQFYLNLFAYLFSPTYQGTEVMYCGM